jgi:outer membrane lipoprotein-sorting protein
MSQNPFDKPDDLLERSLSAIRAAPIPDGPSTQLVAQTLETLKNAQADPAPLKLNHKPLTRKPLTRWLARIAAVIVLIAGVAVMLFVAGKTSSVALADVVQKVREAKTLSFTANMDMPNVGMPIEMKFMMTSSGQTRVEGPFGALTLVDPASGKVLTIQPMMKLAFMMDLGEFPRQEGKGPADFLEQFKKLDAKKAKDLGEKDVDGRRCKGFVSEDQHIEMTVWADKATSEPVRMEMTVPMGSLETKMVLRDFVFDAPIDPALFKLEPPPGYKLQNLDLSGIFKGFKQTSGEEHVIEVLRAYADASDGAFPDKLDDWAAYAKLTGNKAAKFVPNEMPNLNKKQMSLMVHVGALTPFLASLPKDGWAYLGKGAKLGEKEKIIFWYQDPKTKKHRAVYGDLTAKEITADQLPRPAN